jgi:hypothetical protein
LQWASDTGSAGAYAVATAMATRILLSTGDLLEVEASLDEVVKVLENAARSSAGTLARLTQTDNGEPIGVNAAHVVLVRGTP